MKRNPSYHADGEYFGHLLLFFYVISESGQELVDVCRKIWSGFQHGSEFVDEINMIATDDKILRIIKNDTASEQGILEIR